MPAVRPVVFAGALLLVLVACASGSKTTAGDAKGSSTSVSTTTSSSGSSTAAVGSTTPVSVATTHPIAHLVAVRAARQESSDRVVFEFSEQVPGYKVAYSPKPIVGTSDKEVPVAGTAVLVVHMEQASGVDMTGPALKETYSGPARVQPAGAQHLQDVVRVEDFEAVLTWALGINGEVPFRVSTLSSPPRLVIDLT